MSFVDFLHNYNNSPFDNIMIIERLIKLLFCALMQMGHGALICLEVCLLDIGFWSTFTVTLLNLRIIKLIFLNKYVLFL